MMRVLMVSPNYRASSEFFISRHAEYLHGELVGIFTFSPPAPDAEPYVFFGGERNLPSRIVNKGLSILSGKTTFERKFSRVIKTTKPNVVLFQHGTSAPYLYKCCRAENIPYVIHFHGGDIMADHSPCLVERINQAAKLAAINIANSNFIAEQIRRKVGDVPIAVKYMGVEIPVAPVPLPAGDVFKICHVGRLTPKKGPLYSIKAFQKALRGNSRMEFHVVGEGELRDECLAYVQKEKISNVHFYGAMSHDKAMDVMQSCHLLVQHSMRAASGDSEGFGVSLVEAMAIGRPVVSTFHGPIPEVVEDGKTGILVNEGDWQAQGDAILRLANNPDLLARMAGAAHLRAKEKFSTEQERRKLLEILRKCVGEDE